MKQIMKRLFTIGLVATILISSFFVTVFADSDEEKTPSGIAIGSLESTIDTFMKEQIGTSAPGTSIAVVKDDKIIFSKGYGYADVESKIPVTKDTVLEYGSISKLFVWTSVMQLVEAGKLDLDTDIRTYLPKEFNARWKTNYPITMRNIMNHSSGFGEYAFDLIETSAPKKEISLVDAILSAHPKQYYKPGTASVYSNYATALAGYVVECVSGEEFYAYQKAHIFDVLGMNDTAGEKTWKDNPSILENKAQGYTKDGNGGFANTGWSYISLYPAGSINGTAEDLARFSMALMPSEGETSELFTKADTLSTMLSPSYSSSARGTAHGFFEFDSATGEAFGHGGNTASFSAQFVFVPEESFGLVVLTNAAGELNITAGLQDLLIGNNMENVKPASGELPDVSKFERNYVSMRRPEGTASEFLSYLSYLSVKATKTNEIEVQLSGFSGTYIQTAPYTFELTDSSLPLFNIFFSKLIFKTNDDQIPVGISFGKGMDYSSLPKNRTVPLLIGSAITLIVSLLYFLVMPIAILIGIIKRKKRGIERRKRLFPARASLTFAGTALTINTIMFILLLVSNQFVRYNEILPLVMINYLLSIISLVILIFGITKWRKESSRSAKVWFILTAILVIALICLLASWNLFTFWIG